MKSFSARILSVLMAALLGPSPLDADELRAAYALKYGEFGSFPNYAMYWMGDPRFSSNQPPTPVYMYLWLIQTDVHTILVDTGTTDALAERYAPYTSPVDLLARLGIQAEQVDTLIISHPHFDHVDGLSLFPEARIYLQRDAYRFLTESAPQSGFLRESGFPRREDAENLVQSNWDGRVTLLDGDTELFPGLQLIQVDGHHPGHQIVLIETGEKPLVLASDAVHQYANLERNIPMGLFQGELADVAEALETIRALNGIVVAGHDVQVMQRFTVVQPGIVQLYPPAEFP